MDKKHILFVVALILLVVSIVYRAFNPFEQARVEALTYTGETLLPAQSGTLEENRTNAHTVHDTVSRFIDPPRASATRPAPTRESTPSSPGHPARPSPA